MGFQLEVVSAAGAPAISLGIEDIKSVKFSSDIPVNSSARSTYLGTTLTIVGKAISDVTDEADDTSINAVTELAKWAITPAEVNTSYRSVNVKTIVADKTVRDYLFPNAFVVDYYENYGDVDGTGTFTIILKQKKNKIAQVSATSY